MNRKPCLIFNNYGLRLTEGGPGGFLAQNIVGHASPFYYLNSDRKPHTMSMGERIQRRLIGEPHRSLKKIGLEVPSALAAWLLEARRAFVTDEAGKYSWIWFHDIWAMAACLDLIEATQKVILQSHCPELPSEEVAAQSHMRPTDLTWTQAAERRAFARADVCLFPNQEACAIYDSILKSGVRLEYLLSGCRQMKDRFHLPLDSKYTYHLFLGRRNAIKGFDLVIEAFKRAYVKDRNLRLIVIGGGERMDHPGVLDIGRTEEAGSWLASCDYMVSANRQSYFDLSVMEALSLGTPLIIACTNGHQYYAKTTSSGIFPMPLADVEVLEKAFLSQRKKRSENQPACADNRNLYQSELTSERYRARLDILLRGLLS